jgi:hypothetical protein
MAATASRIRVRSHASTGAVTRVSEERSGNIANLGDISPNLRRGRAEWTYD